MLRCVFCGFCVDACPEEAIIMSRNTDMAYFNREQSIVGKADLMKPFTYDKERLGYRPYYPEEERRRAKMRTDAFNLVRAAEGEREGDGAGGGERGEGGAAGDERGRGEGGGGVEGSVGLECHRDDVPRQVRC